VATVAMKTGDKTQGGKIVFLTATAMAEELGIDRAIYYDLLAKIKLDLVQGKHYVVIGKAKRYIRAAIVNLILHHPQTGDGDLETHRRFLEEYLGRTIASKKSQNP
jgi:hypothetical protein